MRRKLFRTYCMFVAPVSFYFYLTKFEPNLDHSVQEGINPPLKTPPSFLPSPSLKSANCPSPPLKAIPPLYRFFMNSPVKVGFFSKSQKYWSFLSLTPSYLLKVTKFLVKTSQFEFLVMTEKNIFVYKLSLPLNISDFSLVFFVKIAPPPS